MKEEFILVYDLRVWSVMAGRSGHRNMRQQATLHSVKKK